MNRLRAFITVVATAVCTAVSAQQEASSLDQALLVEWMMANCDQSKLPALSVMAASMTINGSDATKVTERREFIQKGMKENYPSQEAGCSSLMAGMSQ
jgi:hypothetical protein